jgi:hypothetical protein
LVLDKTYQSYNNQNYYFSAINTNPKAGQVELVSYSMKIVIGPETDEACPRAEKAEAAPKRPTRLGGGLLPRGAVLPPPVLPK